MSEVNPVLNACGYAHDMALIATQPITETAIPHTAAMYRCRRCKQHMSVMLVGRWEFADFHLAEMEQLERDAK